MNLNSRVIIKDTILVYTGTFGVVLYSLDEMQ